MRHDDTVYWDDEGQEYVAPGVDEEEEPVKPVQWESGRLWGADEAYGGYEAE